MMPDTDRFWIKHVRRNIKNSYKLFLLVVSQPGIFVLTSCHFLFIVLEVANYKPVIINWLLENLICMMKEEHNIYLDKSHY